MFLRSLIVIIFGYLAFTAQTVHADLKVKFDCYLVAGPVDCVNLWQNVQERYPFFARTTDEKDAFLSISVRSFELERVYRYVFEFNGSGNLPKFPLIDEQALKTYLPQEILGIVLGDLMKGIAPFLKILDSASNPDGTITLKLGSPSPSASSRQNGGNGWYAGLGGNVSLQAGTTSTINASGDLEVNYSQKGGWRVNSAANISYNRVVVTYADESGNPVEQISEAMRFSNRTVVARTIKDGWSVAVIAVPTRDPMNNLKFSGRGVAGLEWTLVPYLVTNQSTVTVRYVVGAEHQIYEATNVVGKDAMTMIVHGLDAFLRWHFERFDITTGIYGSSIVDNYRFSQTGGYVNLSWRITNNLSVAASGDITYRNALINQPKAINTDNGLDQYIAGGNYANLTYVTTLSLRYTIGATNLNREDQRWR